MTKLFASILMATTLAASPGVVLAQAGGALCGPDGPAEYKRPGGYCEKANGSIYNLHEGEECSYNPTLGVLQRSVRVEVAQNCYERPPVAQVA